MGFRARCRARSGSKLFVGVFMLGAAACDSAPRTPVERGRGTFLRLCASCHGPDGRGGARPGFATPPRDLTDSKFHSSRTDDELAAIIRQGKGQMPAFGAVMPDDEVAQLLLFLRSLSTAPAPSR